MWLIDHISNWYSGINRSFLTVLRSRFLSCHRSQQPCFSLHFVDHLCECVYMTEVGEKAPVHLIDNRCKSLSKGVKGHRCHGNSVWVNARELGAGLGLGVGEPRRGQGSEVITAAFLDKGTTSSSLHLPPDGCWCGELLWCGGIDLDTTPTATATKPHWPLSSRPVETSSAATMVAGGPQWHRLYAARPLPICLTPLHAWPFYRLCLNRGVQWHPWWLPLTPHGVHF